MKLTVKIEMDNAAFEDVNGNEASRILTWLSEQIRDWALQPKEGGPLRDINGNVIGEWRVTGDRK